MATMTCPTCGTPFQQGDLICPECGANLARARNVARERRPTREEQPPAPRTPAPSPPGQQPPPPRTPAEQRQHDQPQQQPQQAPDQHGPQQHGRKEGPPAPHQRPHPGHPAGRSAEPVPQHAPRGTGKPSHGGGGSHRESVSSAPPQMPARREETLIPQDEGRSGVDPVDRSTAFMCPHCEAALTDPAVRVCAACLRPLDPQTPVLRLEFSTGEVRVPPGRQLVLGRDAGQSPVAATFTPFDNVSRRHATVALDPGGGAWVRDERSTNGTYVNGERLPPGAQIPLRDGDTLRLAADVTGVVRFGSA